MPPSRATCPGRGATATGVATSRGPRRGLGGVEHGHHGDRDRFAAQARFAAGRTGDRDRQAGYGIVSGQERLQLEAPHPAHQTAVQQLRLQGLRPFDAQRALLQRCRCRKLYHPALRGRHLHLQQHPLGGGDAAAVKPHRQCGAAGCVGLLHVPPGGRAVLIRRRPCTACPATPTAPASPASPAPPAPHPECSPRACPAPPYLPPAARRSRTLKKRTRSRAHD